MFVRKEKDRAKQWRRKKEGKMKIGLK